MKCPHCNALFASPHATETEANVTDAQNKRAGLMGVTVFSCPVCEAVFSVHPENDVADGKAPVQQATEAATPIVKLPVLSSVAAQDGARS